MSYRYELVARLATTISARPATPAGTGPAPAPGGTKPDGTPKTDPLPAFGDVTQTPGVDPINVAVVIPAFDPVQQNQLCEVQVIQVPSGTPFPATVAAALGLALPKGVLDVTASVGQTVQVPISGMRETVAGTSDDLLLIAGYAS